MDLLQGIERFLRLVSVATRQRGRDYFAQKRVISLTCVEQDHIYSAAVKGGDTYIVGLEFAENVWASTCSCPMEYDCKHVVAAMLELQRRALVNVVAPPAAEKKSPKPQKLRRIAQPPSSPLCDRLVEHLGRELEYPEAEFIRKIQQLYAEAAYRRLTENDLGALHNFRGYGNWTPLELWPELPRDDFYLWLFLARELRRRKARFPAFMDGITDLSLIEAEIAVWEREKEIAHWKGWFQNFDGHAAAPDRGTLELRLALLADEARLQ